MGESHTDKWGLRAFVRRMWKKHSSCVSSEQGEHPELLAAMLSLLRQKLEKIDSKAKPELVRRAKLAEMVLPEIIKVGKASEPNIETAAAKHWAFACGHMLGMLAGCAIKAESMDAAIDEIAEVAKRYARETHEGLSERGLLACLEAPAAPIMPAVSQAKQQHKQMIADLEKQAENEIDPAARSALKAMAEQMRKQDDGEAAWGCHKNHKN